MGTTTTTYSFNKPTVGGDEDAWGDDLNDNWDSVDDLLDGTTVITGGPVFDSATLFADATDDTKRVQFDVSGVTTATTRTATWPDADLTVVGTTTTQTLTNKTLTAPALGGSITGTFDLSGATITYGTALEALDNSSVTGLSGSDVSLVTGTAGTNGNLAQWNGDGDLVDGPDVLDEDDMASDSASAVATQQSIKAYVDSVAIGVGQTRQDVSGSRTTGVWYTNNTGKPIYVSIRLSTNNANWEFLTSTDGGTTSIVVRDRSGDGNTGGLSELVLDGESYRFNTGASLDGWVEIR